MSVKSLGMSLDSQQHSVRLWPSRAEEWVCLAIDGEGLQCEIRMERVHVEALRDHLPDVLAGLDRQAAEGAACQRADIARLRLVDLAAKALDIAEAAEAAEAEAMATSLRDAAADGTTAANAVDTALRAFADAAEDADSATESLIYLTQQAETAMSRSRDNDRPGELVNPCDAQATHVDANSQ